MPGGDERFPPGASRSPRPIPGAWHHGSVPRRSLALCLVATLLASACTATTARPEGGPAEPRTAERLATAPTAAPRPSPEPEPTRRWGRVSQAVRTGASAFVAIPERRYVPMRGELDDGGSAFVFDARSPSGGRAPLLIAGVRSDDTGNAWFEVYLPIRPNGTTAWVHGSEVRVQERTERIEVDLSDRILERYRDGELLDRFVVAVGAQKTPTGMGTFFVWVKVPFRPPHPAYGVFALGLSGFSPALSDWPGEGRMAIHGTPNPGDRGRPVSHGCVRVYNPDMARLTDVPLGTPVIIEP